VRIEQLTAGEISHSSKILKVHGQWGPHMDKKGLHYHLSEGKVRCASDIPNQLPEVYLFVPDNTWDETT